MDSGMHVSRNCCAVHINGSAIAATTVRLRLRPVVKWSARTAAGYHARKIAKVLNGAKPRSLPILFEDPAKIAINLKTCQEIGFDPPVDILGAADEIFTE